MDIALCSKDIHSVRGTATYIDIMASTSITGIPGTTRMLERSNARLAYCACSHGAVKAGHVTKLGPCGAQPKIGRRNCCNFSPS